MHLSAADRLTTDSIPAECPRGSNPVLHPGPNADVMRSLAVLLMTVYWPITVRHDSARAAVPTTTTAPPSSRVPFPLCRDRLGYFPQPLFLVHACAKCLEYLLPDSNSSFRPWTNPQYGFTVLRSAADGRLVTPDPSHPEDMQVVCATLSGTDCRDWKDCCQASLHCCDRQINMHSHRDLGRNKSVTNTTDVNNNQCPTTWDGYSCVDATPAGQTVHFQCPDFLKRFSPVLNGQASKHCLDNSTWYVGAVGLEWTNYDSCYIDYDRRTIFKLKLSFLGFSIALLIPSIAIFCIIRPLRSQLRIKLHINLFVSLALSGLCSLLWEALVSESIMTDSAILHHQVTCKVLNIMSRSSLMSTFFWMFCEGVYLTWLMLNSLRHISSMTFFYFVGWGMPLLITVVYTVVRIIIKNDERCWLADAGRLEWIIDGPTVACIAVNFLFLLAIMRVMLRQLQTHREERPLVVRSLRAMLILVPLFGLQQFFIIYRPQPSDRGFYVYEVCSAAIMNLQGAVLALMFCFFNGEVRGHLKTLVRRLRFKVSGGRLQPRTSLVSAVGSTLTAWRQSRSSIDTSASGGVTGGTQTECSLRNTETKGDSQTRVENEANDNHGSRQHGVRRHSGKRTVENAASAAAFAEKMDESDHKKSRQLSGQDNLGYAAEDVQTLDTNSDSYILESVPSHCGNQTCDQVSDKVCLETIQLSVHTCLGCADATNDPTETPVSKAACKSQYVGANPKLQQNVNTDNIKHSSKNSSVTDIGYKNKPFESTP